MDQQNKLSKTNIMKLAKNPTIAVLILLMLCSMLPVLLFQNYVLTVNAQSSTISSDMLQYEWPMATADLSQSYSSAGPAPDSFNIAWKTKIAGVTGAPVAFGGKVFVQTISRTYALDAATGDIVWELAGTGSLVKLDDTYMMKGTTCVEIADGSTVWAGPTGFAWNFYIDDLKMFVNNQYGWDLPITSEPPALAWNRTNDRYYGIETDRMPYSNGTLFMGTMDNFLIAIDVRTGNTLWATPTTAQFFYRGTYCDGKVIFGGLDNNMHAWNATTGELLWTCNPGTWYGQWASGAATAYGIIYEHNQDSYLYAINATTGAVIWKVKGPGIGYSGFVTVADGKVYSPMGEYQYRDFNTGEYAYSEYNCYDAYTGDLIWSVPLETGAGPSNHECIAYGNMYIIPIAGTPQKPGEWEYQSVSGMGSTLDEVWCISSEVKDWPMLLEDSAHTAEGAGPTNLALKWKFTADSSIQSSPAIVEGVAYFASTAGTIYAVDASTGGLKWSYAIGFLMKSSVAVANGKVYTGTDDGSVYCIDASNGNKLWQTNTGGVKINNLRGNWLAGASDQRASPVMFKSRVYAAALDGYLYCLNANSGAILWKYQTGGPIVATPAIDEDAIFVASCTPSPNGALYKLNLDGNLQWKKDIPYVLNASSASGWWLLAAPTVGNGIVFLRNGLRLCYGINATTGTTVWTYDGDYNPGTASQLGGVLQVNAMLYSNGKVYLTDYYSLTCLNAKNGSVIWTTWLSRENLSPGLAYAHNRIYTVTELGILYVLDATTGEKLSYYDSFESSQMRSAPSLYNGYVYVGANNWNLYCFGDSRVMSASSGQSSSPTPSPTVEPTPTPAFTTNPTATPTPESTTTPTPTASPSSTATQPTISGSNDIYIITAVVVIIVVIAIAAVLLRKRK